MADDGTFRHEVRIEAPRDRPAAICATCSGCSPTRGAPTPEGISAPLTRPGETAWARGLGPHCREQLTSGFQSLNIPNLLCFQIHAWSS